MRRALVAGNWKMNGSVAMSQDLLGELAATLTSDLVEVVVCPPFPYLKDAVLLLEPAMIRVGAQNVYFEEPGAYTGEVSVSMLRDCGCDYVILGHSERRALMSETSDMVGRKAQAALAGGLIPIICVGETAEQRAMGETITVVSEMMDAVTEVTGADAWDRMVLAYEPVWAIGTGDTASPDQAQQVHEALRARLRVVSGQRAETTRILYGGSVNAGNASELFAQPDIDGGLIGGASLDANDFAAICNAAVTN